MTSPSSKACPSQHCISEYLISVGRMVVSGGDPVVRVHRYKLPAVAAEMNQDGETIEESDDGLRVCAVHKSGIACSIIEEWAGWLITAGVPCTGELKAS